MDTKELIKELNKAVNEQQTDVVEEAVAGYFGMFRSHVVQDVADILDGMSDDELEEIEEAYELGGESLVESWFEVYARPETAAKYLPEQHVYALYALSEGIASDDATFDELKEAIVTKRLALKAQNKAAGPMQTRNQKAAAEAPKAMGKAGNRQKAAKVTPPEVKPPVQAKAAPAAPAAAPVKKGISVNDIAAKSGLKAGTGTPEAGVSARDRLSLGSNLKTGVQYKIGAKPAEKKPSAISRAGAAVGGALKTAKNAMASKPDAGEKKPGLLGKIAKVAGKVALGAGKFAGKAALGAAKMAVKPVVGVAKRSLDVGKTKMRAKAPGLTHAIFGKETATEKDARRSISKAKKISLKAKTNQ